MDAHNTPSRAPRPVTFLPRGRATMNLSTPLKQAAEQAIAAGHSRLQVDLRYCSYMDSTFLGTLLSILRTLGRVGGTLELVSPSDDCRQLIESMGLKEVYPVVEEEEPVGTLWQEVAAEAQDTKSFQHHVLHAHEELAEVPGRAGATFRRVADCLGRELRK